MNATVKNLLITLLILLTVGFSTYQYGKRQAEVKIEYKEMNNKKISEFVFADFFYL